MFFRKKKQTAEFQRVERVDSRLKHIAFIMDGNGRWANRRGLPREVGHRIGAETFEKIVRYCGDIGIKTVTVYAFSTENWQRPEKEVSAIINLLSLYIDKAEGDLEKNQIRFIFLGDKSVFPEPLRARMLRLEEESLHYPLTLNLAVNYGGHDEIVHAVNELIASGSKQVSAADIEAHLYTHESPAPDMIVRTGGDIRLSNFLLWQSAYSELYFTDTLWPDMKEADVDRAVANFYSRKRRYGKIQ